MCISYNTVSRQVSFEFFRTPMEEGEEWREEVYQDYRAPFIVHDAVGRRQALIGNYAFVPQKFKPKEMGRLTTMNARAETLGEKKYYKGPWSRGQLCLVPMTRFYEPNYESGAHERWAIEMADGLPFAVAGLYREWADGDGAVLHAFTQITVNANEHALMRRFHADDEKRSLVIVPESEYDDWLSCKNPEMARSFLQLYPAERMRGVPAPKPPAPKKPAKVAPSDAPTPLPNPKQDSLF